MVCGSTPLNHVMVREVVLGRWYYVTFPVIVLRRGCTPSLKIKKAAAAGLLLTFHLRNGLVCRNYMEILVSRDRFLGRRWYAELMYHFIPFL
jgi:hypothetical protein